MANKFYILGSHKTATSTLVGVVNCHPQLFCYYEYVIDNKKIKPKELVKMVKPGNYKWVGDKNPVLGTPAETDKRIKAHDKYKILFTYRNLEEWLSHTSIKDLYNTPEDVIKPTISYLYYLMKSYDFKDCLRLSTEEILFNHTRAVDKISLFFGVNPNPMYDWWKKVGRWKKDPNKSRYEWWIGHSCATKKPIKDVIVERIDHEFWDLALPIFDRWAKGKGPKEDFDKLKEIRALGPLPLDVVMKSIKHTKIS